MEQTEAQPAKKPYAAPHITVLGDIQAITLGNNGGQFLDASFPVNTPKKDLTFS